MVRYVHVHIFFNAILGSFNVVFSDLSMVFTSLTGLVLGGTLDVTIKNLCIKLCVVYSYCVVHNILGPL